jgi:hypothetical protein
LTKVRPPSHRFVTQVQMLLIILICELLQECVIAHVVSHWPLTMKVLIWSQTSLCGICGGQNCTGTVVSLCTVIFPSHYQLTSAQYTFTYLSLTWYNHWQLRAWLKNTYHLSKMSPATYTYYHAIKMSDSGNINQTELVTPYHVADSVRHWTSSSQHHITQLDIHNMTKQTCAFAARL